MKLVVFLGPPGVGKGTQCSLLSRRLGFRHISTGDIIRREIQTGTDLGIRVKALVESGNLVDDESIFLCLEQTFSKINSAEVSTILLDGLPRNLVQGELLNSLINRMSFESVKVICIEAEVEKLVTRFQNRYVCSVCGRIESLNLEDKGAQYLSNYACKSCHSVASMFRRKDDEASTVRHRLDLYQKETLPLVTFYKARNMIHFVDGLMPLEIIYLKVASLLI